MLFRNHNPDCLWLNQQRINVITKQVYFLLQAADLDISGVQGPKKQLKVHMRSEEKQADTANPSSSESFIVFQSLSQTLTLSWFGFVTNINDTWVDPGPVLSWCFFGLLWWAEGLTEVSKSYLPAMVPLAVALVLLLSGLLQGSFARRKQQRLWHFQTNVSKNFPFPVKCGWCCTFQMLS